MNKFKQICIIGAGEHGLVVHELCRALGLQVKAFLDDNEEKQKKGFLGCPVRPIRDLSDLLDAQTGAQIAINNSSVRRRIVEQVGAAHQWATLIHPTAHVERTAKIGQGSMIGVRAIIMPQAQIGAHTIINTNTVIEHENKIGDYVHIAPGCVLAGTVTVGDSTFIGIGARVIPGVTIGKDVVVGAGATVIRSIPDGQTWVGTPARLLR